MARKDERLNDEIQFHIEQQTAKNIRSGMTPEAARRSALLQFGGVENAREAAKDEYRGAVISDFVRDMRISFRSLARVPAFAITAVLTMGLGIGAASAMFSVINGVLLAPLPYPDSGRIVRLNELSATGNPSPVAYPNFEDWRARTHSFKLMALLQNWGKSPVSGAGLRAELIQTTAVSQTFFDVMGVSPALGRRFAGNELQVEGAPAAIVSDAVWRRMGQTGAPNGQTVLLSGVSIPIVGVMPPSFDYPVDTGVWIATEQNRPGDSRTAHNYQVLARLADGVTIDAARADLSNVSRQIKAKYKDDADLTDGVVRPILDVMTTGNRQTLEMLFLASMLLLVVACMNVSNLLVARGASRRREFAVQLAIGAGLSRITRQLLAETLVLTMCGAALGVAIAAVAVRAFVAMGPAGAARVDNIHMSWLSLAFSIGVSMLAALILGLLTAIGLRSVRISEALADSTRTGSGSRRQMRMREFLIVTQVALTIVLMAGAGLLARSLMNVLAIQPGYRMDDALIADVTMVTGDTTTEDYMDRRAQQQQQVIARVRALPGVTGAALINAFPLGSSFYNNGGFVEMTRADEFKSYDDIRKLGPAVKARSAYANYRLVTPGYFEVMGIPLIKGRYIDEGDTAGAAQVAVISKQLADLKWPKQDPLNRYIQYGNMDGDMRGIRIVGVVGDVRESALEKSIYPTVYAVATQRPRQAGTFSLVVRGSSPAALGPAVEAAIASVDPGSPVKLRTFAKAYDTAVGNRRFSLWLIGAFGVVALVLATLGVYGLVSYSVAQRGREMGIRMALGAEPRSLVGLIIRRSLILAVAGSIAGLGLAAAFATLVQGLLFDVKVSDPSVLSVVVGVMVVAAALASYVPARRVLRNTAASALRQA